MKKWFISLIVLCSVIGGLFVGYQYVISFASVKMMDQVQEELLTDDVVQQLLEDPDIRHLADELAKNELNQEINKETLPFTTKEEGLKVVMSKFSISEIKDIAVATQSGLSREDQIALFNQYKDRLSEDELQALLVIGLSELTQK